MTVGEKVYSIEEAAKKLGKGYAYVQKRIKSGQLPAFKIGTIYRITEGNLNEFKQKNVEPDIQGISVSTLAKQFKVSNGLVRNLIKNGEINAVTVGRKSIIPNEEIDRYMNRSNNQISSNKKEDISSDNNDQATENNKNIQVDIVGELKEYAGLLADGIINQNEFNNLKKKLLN